MAFDEDVIVLDLPGSPPQVIDDWKILPLTRPEVWLCLLYTLYIHVELACVLKYLLKLMFSKHSYMYNKQLLHYPQIARVDIVQFKRGRNVPACTVELEWTGSGEPKRLSHQVKIFGAKKPAHFYLRYYPKAVGEFYLRAYMHMCACMHKGRTCTCVCHAPSGLRNLGSDVKHVVQCSYSCVL